MAMQLHLLFFWWIVSRLSAEPPRSLELHFKFLCVCGGGGRCSRHRMKDATAVNKRKADFDRYKAVV